MPIVRQLLHQAKSISFHRNVCINFCATFLASGFQNSKVSKWSLNPRIPLSLSFCIEYVYENNASSCNEAAITRSLGAERTHSPTHETLFYRISFVCFFGMEGETSKSLKVAKNLPTILLPLSFAQRTYYNTNSFLH